VDLSCRGCCSCCCWKGGGVEGRGVVAGMASACWTRCSGVAMARLFGGWMWPRSSLLGRNSLLRLPPCCMLPCLLVTLP
jgi:hypothetical protein